MPLPIDYKINKIYGQIKSEVSTELGVDIPTQAIDAIVNQQIKSTIKAMSNGDTMIWKYFGKFVATEKRVDMLNRSYTRKGKKPTLVDTGYKRVSLDRRGNVINEGEFIPTSVKDLIPKQNG